MKEDFFKYQAQTSPHPLALEISRAKGTYVYDVNGKAYLDFIAGVSANILGHNHPKISQAIKDQVDKYTHVMVYGEFIQKPQVELCKLLAENLPKNLETVYLTNSGTEATEGALKLAKKFTGRSEIIAGKKGYHGNTQGSMSVCGAEEQNSAFRPLAPGIKFIEFNNCKDLEKITAKEKKVLEGCVVFEKHFIGIPLQPRFSKNTDLLHIGGDLPDSLPMECHICPNHNDGIIPG